MEVKSAGDKPLCDICGKQFKQRKNLYEHVRNVHKEEPNMLINNKFMKCPVCNKTENDRRKVYEHLAAVHNITIHFEKKTFNEMNGR